jgi:glyoxylase-like metal-dependent hydrolase (beta-lactamase superfamily II)
MIPVAPGLWRLRSRIANVWLLQLSPPDSPKGGLALIDGGHPFERPNLVRQLERDGLLPCVRALFFTHAHPDHVGCARWLQTNYGIPLVSLNVEAPWLAGAVPPTPFHFRRLGLLSGLVFGAAYRLCPMQRVFVDVCLGDGESHLGMRAIALPGHTPGSTAWLHEASGTLFCGDALLAARPPWTFEQGLHLPEPAYCTNPTQAVASLQRLSRLSFDVLCSGHGDPIGKGADRLVREFLA